MKGKTKVGTGCTGVSVILFQCPETYWAQGLCFSVVFALISVLRVAGARGSAAKTKTQQENLCNRASSPLSRSSPKTGPIRTLFAEHVRGNVFQCTTKSYDTDLPHLVCLFLGFVSHGGPVRGSTATAKRLTLPPVSSCIVSSQ